jgi:protein phosphatase
MTLTLRYAARSDRGLIRSGNEDSVYAGPRLLAVADGMGGMAAGDVASNIVIGTLASLDEDVPGIDLIEPLRRAVDMANQRLRAIVDANPQFEGMGTTLTGMLFSGSRFGMVHIGDSRAYLLRGEEFIQITRDDTYVQMLVDEGRITPEEAGSHPQRSLITQAMGTLDVNPAYSILEAQPGDRYLLCSDGLSAVVSFETIGETLRGISDPAQCVERLIQLALRGGGPDNITVIVADVTDSDIVEGTPIVDGAAAESRDVNRPVDLTSSAGRAAALQPMPPAAPEPPMLAVEDEEFSPRRRPARSALLVAVVLILLAGAVIGIWFYTQAQYYVGATVAGQVAIFKGVPGSVAGMKLSEANIVSSRRVADLTPLAQEKVRKGVQVSGLSKAKYLLLALTDERPDNDNLLPLCPPSNVTSTPTPDASPTPGSSPTSGAVPTPDSSSTPTPGLTDVPTSPPSCRDRK